MYEEREGRDASLTLGAVQDEGAKQCYRSRQSLLREYHINIKFLSVGCVIEVGCKSIPFTNVDEAMTELNNYVKNPQEAVNKWEKIFNQQ